MPWGRYHEGTTYSRDEVDSSFGTHKGKGIFIRNGLVIAFTSEAGLVNGYEDRREGDIFLYYAMGPLGPMNFSRKENKTICDHRELGCDLLLFDEPDPRRNEVRFIGEFECHHYRWPVKALDAGFNVRDAIVFEFTSQSQLTVEKLKELHPEEKAPVYDKGGWKRINIDEERLKGRRGPVWSTRG
jgi:hypothetical protein